MPVETTDVLAASSPAPEETPVTTSEHASQESSETQTLASLTPKQRDEWRRTGEFPTTPKPDASAASTEPASGDNPAEPAPASQPAHSQERKPKGADARKAQLNQEIQDLLKQRNDLNQELERLKQGAPADPPPSQPKPETAKKDAATEDPKPQPGKKPDGTAWKSWDEYQDALLAWNRREATREFKAEQSQAEKTRTETAQRQAIEQNWKKRVDETVRELKVTPEQYAKLCFAKSLPINQTTDGFILDSPIGPKLLYHLATHPEVAQQLAQLTPWDTTRILTRLEMGLQGQSVESAPPTRTTRTPKPAAELSGRNATPGDEEESAVAAGDFRSFKRAADRKALGKKG